MRLQDFFISIALVLSWVKENLQYVQFSFLTQGLSPWYHLNGVSVPCYLQALFCKWFRFCEWRCIPACNDFILGPVCRCYTELGGGCRSVSVHQRCSHDDRWISQPSGLSTWSVATLTSFELLSEN